MQQGMRENARKIARQLLNVLDSQTISQITGLIVEDIQNWREECKEGKKYDRTISTLFLATRISLVAQVFESLPL